MMKPQKIDAEAPAGREKLLNSALLLFARDGYDATSLRAVADDAGVSWGLVRFYFGSKEGLRDAVEKCAIRAYLDQVHIGVDPIELATLIEMNGEALPLVTRYLRRAIMEERPAALEFLRQLFAAHQQIVQPLPDDPAIKDALRNFVTRVGYLLLAPQILELTGRDVFSKPEVLRRNLSEVRLVELAQLGLAAERTEES